MEVRSLDDFAPGGVLGTPEDGRQLLTLIQNPMPLVRAAGEQGYETGQSNPYQDTDGPLYLNWEAGYRDARQRDS